jgi:hypothetical protein
MAGAVLISDACLSPSLSLPWACTPNKVGDGRLSAVALCCCVICTVQEVLWYVQRKHLSGPYISVCDDRGVEVEVEVEVELRLKLQVGQDITRVARQSNGQIKRSVRLHS